jgi:hypothetical protein
MTQGLGIAPVVIAAGLLCGRLGTVVSTASIADIRSGAA